MRIKTVESTSSWPFKVPILVLILYVFVVLPSTQIFFKTNLLLYEYADILFFAGIVLVISYKTNLVELGFSAKYLNQHLVIGLISGGTLLLSLHLLNLGLEATGLTDHKIFEGRSESITSHDLSFLLGKAVIVILISLIEQIFFTGFILQSLLKKINSILAVYAGGLFYTLAGFKMSFGTFALGIFTSFLFKITGTLYAPILFHISCGFAGELLKNVYPKMTTILGFLQ